MEKITHISGAVIPLHLDNVDTDLIIPAQYLTSITKEGYGENVFRRLRDEDPAFPFNQEKFKGATVLVTKENFGCGSSREHAVWALRGAGIQAIIATSFADIFFNNAAENGLILIEQPSEVINSLLTHADAGGYHIEIDIENQRLKTSDNTFDFDIEPFHKHCFVNGLNELDYLLDHFEEIKQHKQAHAKHNFVCIESASKT